MWKFVFSDEYFRARVKPQLLIVKINNIQIISSCSVQVIFWFSAEMVSNTLSNIVSFEKMTQFENAPFLAVHFYAIFVF